jgi:glycosyltransferase involved in cell wall biosynthesis
MHIVYITHEYPLPGQSHGGIGTFVGIMSKALTELGVRVSVVGTGTTWSGQHVKDGKINVYRTAQCNKLPILGNFLNRWAIALKIRQLHKKHPVFVVEAPEMGLAFMPKWSGITYVIRMNGGHHFFAEAEQRPVSKWRAFQEIQSFKRADFVCAVSHYVAERTRNLLALGNISIPIIPNPSDSAKFHKAVQSKAIPNKILFVGSVCKKKGIEELVAAMPLVWKVLPEAQLEIVGRDVADSRYGGSFVAYLKNTYDQDPRVRFVGQVPNSEIPTYIEQAAICVYPSYMEALPLAWLEAMAMGKPFVGSVTGPGPEVITHGENGLLVNPREPKEIAKAIVQLLTDTAAANEMGNRARQTVEKTYDATVLAKVNKAYYEKIIKA